MGTFNNWKSKTQKIILTRLFINEDNRLNKNLIQIILKNQEIMHVNSFFYQQRLYTSSKTMIKGTLHPSLNYLMENHLKDLRKIDYDKGRINQILALLLDNVNNLQDLRDALPNCLVDIVDEIRTYSRTREEAYNLIDNPRLYKQYMSIKPLIEFYSVIKLLY